MQGEIRSFTKEPGFEEVISFLEEKGKEALRGCSVINQTVFSAYFDILGFREAAKADPSKLYETYKEALDEARSAVRPVAASSRKKGEAEWEVEVLGCQKLNAPMTFSDATFIITTDASLQAFRELCHVSNRIFFHMMARGLPIRGAISRGNVFWDIERGVYLGEALTSAYEFGEQMDAVGICINPAAMNPETQGSEEIKGPIPISFHGGRKLNLFVPVEGSIVPFSVGSGEPEKIWKELYAQAHERGSVSLISKYQNSNEIFRLMVPNYLKRETTP